MNSFHYGELFFFELLLVLQKIKAVLEWYNQRFELIVNWLKKVCKENE